MPFADLPKQRLDAPIDTPTGYYVTPPLTPRQEFINDVAPWAAALCIVLILVLFRRPIGATGRIAAIAAAASMLRFGRRLRARAKDVAAEIDRRASR